MAQPSGPAPSPEDQIDFLQSVYRALDDTTYSWVVLRGGYESVLRNGDVDILVDPVGLAAAMTALEAVGYVEAPSAGQGSHRFMIRYDPAVKHWIKLDLTTRVEFGDQQQFPTRVAAGLLEDRRRMADRWQLSADDQFWHLFLHRFLSSRILEHPELTLAAKCAEPIGALAALVDRSEVAGASSRTLLELARSEDWRAISALRPAFIKTWQSRGTASLVKARLSAAARRATHALRSVRRPTGLTVTIIGPDGAGKTTLAEALRETLPMPSRYVYMGVWRAYPRDRWLRFIPGARLVQRMGRLQFRSMQAWYHRLRGRVVLLDRFTYDVFLPSPGLDVRGKLTVWLVKRLSAEPHLIIVLNAPAELMFARKGEQGVEELERRRLTYLEVARTRDFSVVVDATQSREDVRVAAETALFDRLRRHWKELS